jgi:hypothetical protein
MWVERSYLEVKVWRSSEMQHWNPSLLLVFPVDSISPQLRRTSDQVGLMV